MEGLDCDCADGESGNFYVIVGHASSVIELQKDAELRLAKLGYPLMTFRMQELLYRPQDSNVLKNTCIDLPSPQGRLGPQGEDVCVSYRRRRNHTCSFAVVTIGISIWAELRKEESRAAYDCYVQNLPGIIKPQDRDGVDGPRDPCKGKRSKARERCWCNLEPYQETYYLGCLKVQ